MRRSLRQLPLLTRFSLLSLLAVCMLGALVGTALHAQIQRSALDSAQQTAVIAGRLGAVANLSVRDVTTPLSRARIGELDRTLAAPLAASGITAVKVYARDGRIAYASDHGDIGNRDHDAAEELAAGKVIREMTRGIHDTGLGPRTLSIYAPVRVGGARTPNALFELYKPYAPVAAAIARDTRDLALLLAGGLALLWASLFRVVASASRRLRRQARQDHLTGLPNRAALHAAGRGLLAPTARAGNIAALLLIDLDRFKEVNDTLGHDQGDALLCDVADRLRQILRPSDTLARLGGDEFAILVRDLPDRSTSAEIAVRVSNTLRRPFDLCGVAIELGASIGIALYPDHGTDLTGLLRRADVAMYEGKRRHEAIVTYDRTSDPYSPERLALVAELRSAITADELVLHYQPKIEIGSGAVAGVEALVRWNHPVRGLLAPADFIPLAERTGLICAVTRWVLDAALLQCRAWLDAGRELSVAINLSGADVLDAGLADVITSALERAGVPGSLLECEISEDTVLADPRRAIENLSRLRALGVRLSLDDFGQGQSSLSYLKRLPLDQIKIDRSFVIGMGADPSDAAIVRTTIDLGRNLGLEVVAEGVENDAAFDELAALRCDVAQGFGLSRPLPAADLETWLTTRAQRVAR